MSILIKNITKKFGNFVALNDVSLNIGSGELVALLGPSGSGKTTLLRIIAGLEIPDSGEIFIKGNCVEEKDKNRKVGFVFQHYALFKHMTVFENVAFGLRVKPKKERPSKEEIKKKVMELLSLVQLESMASRFPNQLSGGQRQRVALARVLAIEPSVLLLDEPFGALDAKVRQELRRWLRRFHDELKITTVFVTHDQDEALEVADKVVILNKGCIEQVGTPMEVYEHPASSFVLEFIGNVNVFHGRIQSGVFTLSGIGDKKDVFGNYDIAKGYIRPHEIEVKKYLNDEKDIKVKVVQIQPMGSFYRLFLEKVDSHEFIEAHISKDKLIEQNINVGDDVFINLKNLKVFVEDYVI